MWSFVRVGFQPIEALQAATIVPARHLGFDQDLGSLEGGKLADLVVVDSNPLEEITNTDKVSLVMINGRLYKAATMNEVYSSDKMRPAYYWE
jgi:imidazolonepropionase-like amidohydrolase|tara:strand:- start:21 stop:296 length:276 start_codon:yes stop_codon:yes gene_type:complete